MAIASDFTAELEAQVAQQLKSQRVGYLLGAGSSYLNGIEAALDLLDDDGANDTPYRHLVTTALGDSAVGDARNHMRVKTTCARFSVWA